MMLRDRRLNVKVKPLEWRAYRNMDAEAMTAFGEVYTAYAGGAWRITKNGKAGKFVHAGADINAAKAAAQADYEARILSTLLSATPEPTEPVKLLQRMEAPVISAPSETFMGSFQSRVEPWMLACFGELIAGDREERNHRFLEEALELVQSTGCTKCEAHQLVDYVYGRAVGEPYQEVGGVMVTLAALCLANALDMHDAAETELARIWTKVEEIRAKQAAKPKHSPLPGLTNS